MALSERVTLQNYSQATDFTQSFSDLLSIGGTVVNTSSLDAGEREIISDSQEATIRVKWTRQVKQVLEVDRTATWFSFRGQRYKIIRHNRTDNNFIQITGELQS